MFHVSHVSNRLPTIAKTLWFSPSNWPTLSPPDRLEALIPMDFKCWARANSYLPLEDVTTPNPRELMESTFWGSKQTSSLTSQVKLTVRAQANIAEKVQIHQKHPTKVETFFVVGGLETHFTEIFLHPNFWWHPKFLGTPTEPYHYQCLPRNNLPGWNYSLAPEPPKALKTF